MQEFKLPDLGEGMEEAEIRQWLVAPGDTIKLDQPMVEVETDKAVLEIPSPVAGKITALRVQAGEVAKRGDVLVVFESSADSDVPSSVSLAESSKDDGAVRTNSTQAGETVPATRQRIPAAPAVRKRASELGVNLELVTPSQPSGRVTMEDLQVYLQHASSEERQPLAGLRKRIAEHMERSWRTVPHATAFDELDGTEFAALHQVLKPVAEQRGVRLTYIPLLIKLLISVLKEFPIFNASLDEVRREIVYKHAYHIGIATDSPEGLLVPVLRNADQLSLLHIARQLGHLVERAQKRTLSPPEVTGSTFTLNNIGSFGGSSGTPIINYPEVAILAVGRLQEKAIVHDGSIVVRTMMPLALSFDHRVVDGAMAGKFLTCFRELVERPQQLMLDMV